MKATFKRAWLAVLALLACLNVGCATRPQQVEVVWFMLDYQFSIDWFAKSPPDTRKGEPGLKVPNGLLQMELF